MATLVKKEGSPFWYARFQYQGKDYWRSTKETKKQKAQKALARIQSEVEGDTSLSSLFDQVLARLTDVEDTTERDKTRRRFARRLLQGLTSKLPIADAWDSWQTNPRKRNPNETTQSGYRSMWNRFESWLLASYKGLKSLHEVTETMTENYASDLWGSGVSPSTYNGHISFLRSMFRVLSIKAGIELNPWERIPLMEKETESRRNLEVSELKAVCQNVEGDMRVWFALALYTGMRLGDAVHLRWSSINFRKGYIEYMPRKTARKRKTVRAPLHQILEAILEEHKKNTRADKAEYLFPEAVKTYRRDRGAITKLIQAFFKQCGIQTKEKPTNGHRQRQIVRVGFHSLRHSFVSLCAANKVPEVAIMELVGHGSPAMTRLYSHAGDDQKAKAIAALPEVSFEKEKAKTKRKK